VIARTPCTLLKITRASFDHIMAKRPSVGIVFLQTLSKSLSQNLRRTCGQFADASESAVTTTVIKPVLSGHKAKQTKLIDHIINRKKSNLPPLIRQII